MVKHSNDLGEIEAGDWITVMESVTEGLDEVNVSADAVLPPPPEPAFIVVAREVQEYSSNLRSAIASIQKDPGLSTAQKLFEIFCLYQENSFLDHARNVAERAETTIGYVVAVQPDVVNPSLVARVGAIKSFLEDASANLLVGEALQNAHQGMIQFGESLNGITRDFEAAYRERTGLTFPQASKKESAALRELLSAFCSAYVKLIDNITNCVKSIYADLQTLHNQAPDNTSDFGLRDAFKKGFQELQLPDIRRQGSDAITAYKAASPLAAAARDLDGVYSRSAQNAFSSAVALGQKGQVAAKEKLGVLVDQMNPLSASFGQNREVVGLIKRQQDQQRSQPGI